MGATEQECLQQLGFIDANGNITEDGFHILKALLNKLPPVHKGKWGEVFVPLMEKLVPACVELVIIKDHKMLLTYRDDKYFKGWHFPGSYIGPKETLNQTAQRCAKEELGVEIEFSKCIGTLNKIDGPRFHDFSNLMLCFITN